MPYVIILNPARLPIPPSGQSVDIQQVDKVVLQCYTLKTGMMYRICIGSNKKGNMKEWLDNQRKIEDSLLNAVAIESKEIAEDLMPQVRLCALENEKLSIFDGIERRSESVRYPPRVPGGTRFGVRNG